MKGRITARLPDCLRAICLLKASGFSRAELFPAALPGTFLGSGQAANLAVGTLWLNTMQLDQAVE